MNLLPSLHDDNCQRCKLSELRTNIVPSFLPDTAEVLFIAEAPGMAEDEAGTQPLIGSAGKLLNDSLQSVGMSRSDPRLAFSNVVRCRPRETDLEKLKTRQNRPPKDTEIRACSSFLDREIASLPNLKLIVALGAVAAKRLLGNTGVKLEDLRGKVVLHEKYGQVLVTYHPARLLHVDSRELPLFRSRFLEDLSQVKSLLDGEVPSLRQEAIPVDHHVVKTLEQAVWLFDQLNSADIFSFDIETSDFDFLESKILSISFSWRVTTAVTLPFYKQDLVPLWSDRDYEKVFLGLKQVLENPATKKVAHNGKFDIQHLFTFGISVQNFYADTMLMHFLLDENSPHDLKSLAWTFTDRGGYDQELEDIRKVVAKQRKISYKEVSFDLLPSETLWKYANMDADVTLRLFYSFWGRLERENLLEIFFELFMPMSKFLGKIEYLGVSVDQEYLDTAIEEYRNRIHEKEVEILQDKEVQKYIEHRRQLQDLALREKWSSLKKRPPLEEYLRDRRKEISFNFSSPKQLRELFIDQLGLKVFKATAKGNPSLDDEALEHYSKKIPVAKLLSQRNKLVHLLSTFLEGMKNAIRSDGRLHTSFNLHVATTGRLSSTKPNLQNIPNVANNPEEAKTIRNIFVADPGCTLIEADFAQAEFRIFGQLSQDPILYEDLRNGIDIHTKIGALGFSIPESEVTKKQRADAKTVVFGTMYGRTPESVAEQLDISVAAAKALQDAMFKRYKKAAGWIRSTIVAARRDKYVRGLFGQIRHLEGQIDSPNAGIKKEAERQAINSPIQGSSSQMCCFAALRIDREFERQGLKDARVLLLIHDAIMCNVRDEDKEIAAQIMRECMLHPHPKVTIPLSIDMKWGKRWGELESVSL